MMIKRGLTKSIVSPLNFSKKKKSPTKKVRFIFGKVPDFPSPLWYVIVLAEKNTKEE